MRIASTPPDYELFLGGDHAIVNPLLLARPRLARLLGFFSCVNNRGGRGCRYNSGCTRVREREKEREGGIEEISVRGSTFIAI